MSNILVYDIEATNLSADMGFVICITYQWFGESKTHTISIKDYPEFKKHPTWDKKVVQDFREVVNKADAVIAHFGTYFDVPYVNTRLLIHKLHPAKPVHIIDTWKIFKQKLRLHSNRLASGIEAFAPGIKKTPLRGPVWVKATAGDKKSIEYVEKHCVHDVKALSNVYRVVRSLDTQHPNLSLIDGRLDACPVCKAKNSLIKKGYVYSKTAIRQAFQCKKCGSWPSRPLKGGRIRP